MLQQKSIGKYLQCDYIYSYRIEKILTSNIPESMEVRFPIYRILRELAKMFHFRSLQALVFNMEIKWNQYQELCEIVYQAVTEWQPFVTFQTSLVSQYRMLLVYLLFLGYRVKRKMNLFIQFYKFEKMVKFKFPRFKKYYLKWLSQQLPKEKVGYTLKELNSILINYNYDSDIFNEREEINFNRIVDCILEMSKPYNKDHDQEEQQRVTQKQKKIKKVKTSFENKMKSSQISNYPSEKCQPKESFIYSNPPLQLIESALVRMNSWNSMMLRESSFQFSVSEMDPEKFKQKREMCQMYKYIKPMDSGDDDQ